MESKTGLMKKKQLQAQESDILGGEGADMDDEKIGTGSAEIVNEEESVDKPKWTQRTLNKSLISKMSIAIEDAGSEQEIADTAAKIFVNIAFIANSVQGHDIVKLLKGLGKDISTKIKEYSESHKDFEPTIGQRLFEKIVENLIEAFGIIAGASTFGSSILSFSAALGVLTLALEFLNTSKKQFSLQFSGDLARVLVAPTQYLTDKQAIFNEKTLEVNTFLTLLPGYTKEGFIGALLERPLKYTYLALVSQASNDNGGIQVVCKKFCDLVINDREKLNHQNIQFFIPFLKRIDEVTFKTQILPEIEFMMNRNASLIPLIGETISALSFPFTPEIVHMITSSIFSDDYMTKEESLQNSQEYFAIVSAKLTTSESASALIIDFLVKKFLQSKGSSLNATQRLALIRHIGSVLHSLKNKELIDQVKLQPALIAILEHYISHKDEATLKDSYKTVLDVFVFSNTFSFLSDSLSKVINRTASIWHVNLFSDLLDLNIQEWQTFIAVAAGHFKTMLSNENFKTTANYSMILSLSGFFCSLATYSKDPSPIQWMVSHEGIMGYFCTSKGFANSLGYFQKNPSLHDVKNHLKVIELLSIHHYTEHRLAHGDSQLRDTLCEYILNEGYNFREHLIIDCIDRGVQKSGDLYAGALLKSFYNKLKQISQRPPIHNRDEAPHKQSLSLNKKVKLVLKYSLKHKHIDLTQEEFFTVVKTISHPFVSSTNKKLLSQLKSLESVFGKEKLASYFKTHGQQMADYAIRQRAGILSHDATLRAMAINIGVILAQQGLMELFIGNIAQILNYKSLEMSQKLERILSQEFDRISHYDLMFYSEISSDLLNVFKERDTATIKKELAIEVESTSQESESQEESKGEEPPAKALDPAKLAAQMLKKAAAQNKAAAGAKKAVPAKAAPVKPAIAKKPAAQKEEAPTIDKETRNKMDREQLLHYINEIQRIKGVQIEAALEIIKRANINNLFLDLTLDHLLMPMVKLLNYPSSRFATILCFQSLFQCHRLEPLFQVKNEVVSCLSAISAQKIFIKHMREFQVIFQHIENNTQVQLFDRGYVQLVVMMANYVLKDLSVHLSVKEQALAVIQSILESNTLVENIDLVIVTINMMKSSYNNENLSQYINLLLKRLSLEQLALILQRIFEYEPVPRMILLRELIEFEMPLCCPVWFSAQIWVLQFDEECGKLARKLWNKYGMVLRSGCIDLSKEHENRNMYYYLRSKNTNIFDNTIRGIISAIEIFSSRYDLIVDDLIEFYNQELAIIEQECIKAQATAMQIDDSSIYARNSSSNAQLADDRLNRIAIGEIIKRTAHFVQAGSFKKIFDFFITKGCLDQNEHVQKACMDAALQVIQAKGSDYSEEILKILEKYINEQKKYSELSKNQAIIMIGALANYLDNTSQKKLVGTFEKMLELLNTPSELIRQSICKVIPQLARFFDDKSKKLLDDHMKILRETQDEKLIRGSAYAVSGIVKGLGLQNFYASDILTVIHKECFTKHADPLRKISGLYLYETLTISLGKVFEMNVEKILPDIMLCIADPKEQVRKAALQANRTIMSKLSNHAIKQVLPIFLKGLYNDNWRSKLASVEALGNTAFCAPRQIAFFLPQIVKGIREVLSDTHEKVHEAALQAIQNIGSVIKCPEIAEILETLVKALSNPNLYLKNAMKVLLDTSFVHAIDAPSLSLLIPILDSGLMMHDNESKHLASKLMGNICNLTQDPEDLLPYIKILMPAIKNSLFDSIPEIRASASKALGSLSRGLGLANSEELLVWLHQVLNQKQLHSSERAGAAQGFAEIISVHGTKYFEDTIKAIIVKVQDPLPHIRESYRSIMVFLATCYDQFVKYLPKLLPIMIQGLSDDVEDVRKISLRNVKICIKLFGKQAPNQLVLPIMEMMFNKDFRVRQSSSVLMYQLVKELENDVIKSQPKYITQEVKSEILSCMFILKYDIIERVATQASQIWKNIIDNQLKVLKSIINVLIQQIFDIIQSDQLELQEMGLNCMRGITEKFGEKFVSDTLDILESYMERATTNAQTVAITKAIYNMAYAAPTKLLTDLRMRFLTVVDGNIADESQEIKNITAKVFITVFQKTFEPNFMTQTLDKHFLKKLHHFISNDSEKEANYLVYTLKQMLKEQSPELKLEDKIIRLCNTGDNREAKLTIAQARVLGAVAAKIGANFQKKKNCAIILEKMMNELTIDEIDDEKRINEVLITFSEIVAQSPESEILTVNESVISDFHHQCRARGRLSFYVDFIAFYCQNAKVNYEKYAKMYLQNVLTLMNDDNEKLVEKVIKGFSAIVNGLQQENQFTLIPLIKECIEDIAVQHVQVGQDHLLYKKKIQTIKMLEKPEGVKNLSAVIQNSITKGSLEIRIDSAICFQYLIDFSKPEAIKTEVIKICGALIRVVNDKFQSTLKFQIFHALKLILLRVSAFAKAMAPQLQTTFLKAFNDNQATALVRKEVVDCLIHFLKIAPKVDPVLKELSLMIEGDKTESNAKIEVSEILAIILRLNGKSLQAAMSSQIQTTLMNILNSKDSQYNDKTIVNCAVSLAFLSAYSADQSEMIKLFESFDSRVAINISLGIKFGILLNGNSQSLKDKFQPSLESYLKDFMNETGILEIDGHDSYDSDVDGDLGRLHGSFEILAHIGDSFIRRFAQPEDEVFVIPYRVINQAGIFSKLNAQSALLQQTFDEVLFFLSSIPVKGAPFSKDLKQILNDGFEFINKFYLEFKSKRLAQPAVQNMLMLNYDNFLDVNDDSKIVQLTPDLAKEVAHSARYLDLMSEFVRSTAVELVFI